MRKWTPERRRLEHIKDFRENQRRKKGVILVACVRCGKQYHIRRKDRQVLVCADCYVLLKTSPAKELKELWAVLFNLYNFKKSKRQG